MIKLYGMSSPNVFKVVLMLTEAELAFDFIPVNIWDNEQFSPEFVALNANSKVPVLVDPEGPGGRNIVLSESGAILYYLADTTGRFLPTQPAERFTAMQWLMFQMASVGPMFGQANHFRSSAPAGNDYGYCRYNSEVHRLFDVLEHRLQQTPYLAGDNYSIADMAVFPWSGYHQVNGVDLGKLPALARWIDAIAARPATAKAMTFWTSVEENSRARRAASSQDGRDRLYGRGAYDRSISA